MNSEPVVPEDDIIVVFVVAFLCLEGDVVGLIVPSFSLDVPFPTRGLSACRGEVFSRKLHLKEDRVEGILCLLLQPFLPSPGSSE